MKIDKYTAYASTSNIFFLLAALRKAATKLSIAIMPIALYACSSYSLSENRGNVIEANTSAKLSPTLVGSESQRQLVQEKSYSLLIHRRDRFLEVFDSQGVRLWKAEIGIGKGGLKTKKNMADSITPTGEMTVDLILYRKPEYNKVAQENAERFTKNAEFGDLVSDRQGLARLYNNMNRLDFDGNGSPDRAYGDGYIGLTSSTTVTGPKMSTFRGTPYWFSIALHGTPNPENIGRANSGGCVHLDARSLQQLIENGWVKLGTKVKIAD